MQNKELQERHLEMLKTALGSDLVGFLAQDDVIEIMANPDGRVWLDTLSKGKYLTSFVLPSMQRLNVIKLIASFNQLLANEVNPEVACEIQFAQARFQGWIYPVSAEPTFTIRKKARQIFTLNDYVEKEWLTQKQLDCLKLAIKQRLNMIVAGGTGSGKTTFANALLNELAKSTDRIVVLEDLPELQVSSEDMVTLRTTAAISMQALVKGSLRMRPDRVIIGEVRDHAALDLLKVWNTGHPGGFCTIHANRADSVVARLEDLILEAVPQVPHRLINEAVDLVIFMQKSGHRDYLISEMKPLSDKAQTLFADHV